MRIKLLFLFLTLFFILSFSLFSQDIEDFETGDFSSFAWQLSGDADWFVTSTAPYEGSFCAQGGDIDDNQETSISITRDVNQPSNISFYWKVDSENNWDYLRFFIDGEEITNITGNQDWTLFQTEVSIGTHTFKWSYTKDSSVSQGEDTGWIDYITFPMSIVYDNDLAITSFSVNGSMFGAGTALTATCQVKNVGNLPSGAFSLFLKDSQDNVLSSMDISDEFQPGDTQQYDLDWNIPTDQPLGETLIYMELVYANDENTLNNTSPQISIHILPAGITSYNIGDGDETSNKIPIDFFYKSSISETIYYPDELPPQGTLYSIIYYYEFNETLTDQPINIWIGETDQEGLDEGWISAPNLQQVFSGNLDFPQEEGFIYIPLDNPYLYSGQHNLVILVERPLDIVYYSSQDYFLCTSVSTHQNRCRSYYNDSTPLDPQNLNNDQGQIRDLFPNTTLGFIVGGLGDIEGYVYNENNQPLPNASVQIIESGATTNTDNQGYFHFGNISPDIYSLQADYQGYNPQIIDSVLVVEDSTTIVQFNLQPLSTASIGGHVVGSDAPNTPLVGALVSLTGFADYDTTTDDNGDFVFPDVYCGHSYQLTVSFAGYSDYTDTIDFGNESVDLGTITLNEIAYPPANVMAEQNDTQTVATVYWSNTGSFSGEFRYDDGTMVGQIGSASTPPRAAFGAKFLGSAILNELRWYLTSEYATHTSVNLFVFSLDANYLPTNNIIFEADNIPNTDNEWNSYILNSPLEADFGFLIALSTPNIYTGLGYDDGVGAPWEFVSDTQYATDDYLNQNWTPIETYGFYNNLMIRAYGSPIANKNRSLESYKIYRFNVADQNNPDSWDVIAENVSLQDTMYVDESYEQLPIGNYRYAVSSIYTNNVESQPTLSNVLVKTMVDAQNNEITPLITSISQNYPNPFTPSSSKSTRTYFNIQVKEGEEATLTIYNIRGQIVKRYRNIPTGKHKISWDGRDYQGKKVTSGVYLYKFKTKSTNIIRKIVLIKK